MAEGFRQVQLSPQPEQPVFQIPHCHGIRASRHACRPGKLRISMEHPAGIAGNHAGQQHRIQPAVGYMENTSQAMGDGVADAQPSMGKGNAGHGGGKVHPQTHLLLSCVRGREHRIGHAKALPCIHIGKRPGVGGRVGFQPVSQHVKSRIRNQPRRQLFEQVAVQNCRTGAQPFVNQGVLCLSMGQNGEVRHL